MGNGMNTLHPGLHCSYPFKKALDIESIIVQKNMLC